IVAHGIVPRYSDIDTYHMMACSIDEAIRNSISVGGKPGYIAGLDNFCWCDPIKSPKNPDGEYKLAQLVRACQALFDYCTYYDLPCISGKDSMKNDFVYGDIKISIPPTVLFSTMGKIDDVQKAITMDAKNPQDVVYVIGITKPELGGSEYFASKGFIGNNVPKVDAPRAKRLYQLLSSAIERGFVASCHDCSDGGLGVALAETAFSGDLGMEIDLNKVPNENVVRDDYLLFSESQSRFVITVDPKKVFQIEALLKDNYFARVGVVREDKKFLVKGKNGEYVIDCDIDTLKYAWQKTLKW
ncbi:MAG: AIR synthase-related protein, partial [Thermodesulfobacteriota bacterium]|nr:AIR synthase-related protein [Thermodesulfobacteriota bacterium]